MIYWRRLAHRADRDRLNVIIHGLKPLIIIWPWNDKRAVVTDWHCYWPQRKHD